MIGLIVWIIFVCAALGIFFWGMSRLWPMVPVGEPFRTIIYVLVVMLVAFIVLFIIYQLFMATGVTTMSIEAPRFRN